MKIKRIFVFLLGSLIVIGSIVLHGKTKENWISIVEDCCIYKNNSHAAFTSQVEWNGNKMLAFREGKSHRASETDKGVIRVLEKENDNWSLQHTFELEGVDLRDPCFFQIGDKLMLYTCCYYSEYNKEGWSELKNYELNTPLKPAIWKIRVYNGAAYGIGFSQGKWPLLFKSYDGINWEYVSSFKIGGNASEADMVFIDDTMYICIRIDTPVGSNSMWGKSKYPFKKSEWSLMDISVASPEMIVHSDKTILLAGREYLTDQMSSNSNRCVSLFALNKEGKVKKRYVVDKSGSDQGYPSLYRGDDDFYQMSYYTGNSNNTSIRYLSFKIKDNNF